MKTQTSFDTFYKFKVFKLIKVVPFTLFNVNYLFSIFINLGQLKLFYVTQASFWSFTEIFCYKK